MQLLVASCKQFPSLITAAPLQATLWPRTEMRLFFSLIVSFYQCNVWNRYAKFARGRIIQRQKEGERRGCNENTVQLCCFSFEMQFSFLNSEKCIVLFLIPSMYYSFCIYTKNLNTDYKFFFSVSCIIIYLLVKIRIFPLDSVSSLQRTDPVLNVSANLCKGSTI